MNPSRKNKSAFTLLEILTVLAISCVILGSLGLGLKHIGGSNSLMLSSSLISDMANLARQNSISKNTQTSFVIGKISAVDGSKYALALFELQRSNGESNSGEWRQIHKWETLPPDISIDESTFLDEDEALEVSFPNFRYGSNAITDFEFVSFLPQGSLSKNETAQLHIIQTNTPLNKSSSAPASSKAPSQKSVEIYILWETGRVKINYPE